MSARLTLLVCLVVVGMLGCSVAFAQEPQLVVVNWPVWMTLTAAEGVMVSVSIVGVWVIAWVIRMAVQALRVGDGVDDDRE